MVRALIVDEVCMYIYVGEIFPKQYVCEVNKRVLLQLWKVDNLLKEPFVDELQTIMEATPLFANTFRSPLSDDPVRI